MRCLISIAAFTFAVASLHAAPVVLAPEAVEMNSEHGSTYADARLEAARLSKACRAPGNACDAAALKASALVPQVAVCGDRDDSAVWRLAQELSDGGSQSERLQRLALSREVFDCCGPACLAVLPTTWPSDARRDLSTLSVCRVLVVGDVAGPPNGCREALKKAKGAATLLRGKAGNAITSCSMGLRDFDAVFRGRAGDVAAVRKLVGEVLHAKPFQLAVMEDGDAIVGTRAHLASDVMRGWREWVTVRVEVDVRKEDVGTSIFTTMLVSKQATASRDAWSPPSEPQEATYIAALRDALLRRGGALSTGVGR